MIVESQLQ